jgi:hypothetical protein
MQHGVASTYDADGNQTSDPETNVTCTAGELARKRMTAADHSPSFTFNAAPGD